MDILKNSNVIAAAILGLCLLISALIVNSGLSSVSSEIRKRPSPPSAHVPSEFTVRVRNADYQPLKVDAKQ